MPACSSFTVLLSLQALLQNLLFLPLIPCADTFPGPLLLTSAMPVSIHKRRVSAMSCRPRCSSAPLLSFPGSPESPTDARQEIRAALALLRRDSLEAFRERWGFDPVVGEPIPGQHHTWRWMPFTPPQNSPCTSPMRDLASAHPLEENPRHPDSRRECKDAQDAECPRQVPADQIHEWK